MLRACLFLGLLILPGCLGYRVVRPDSVRLPDYAPREVAVPEVCDRLAARAAADSMLFFTSADANMLDFCQNQQLIRAQEEEAASRKLEAHAEAASFVLRATVSP